MIHQRSAEVTHSENGTGIRNEMRTAIIHAEGVLFRGRGGQAISSTPEACGVPFIIRAEGAHSAADDNESAGYRGDAMRASLWRRYWK